MVIVILRTHTLNTFINQYVRRSSTHMMRWRGWSSWCPQASLFLYPATILYWCAVEENHLLGLPCLGVFGLADKKVVGFVLWFCFLLVVNWICLMGFVWRREIRFWGFRRGASTTCWVAFVCGWRNDYDTIRVRYCTFAYFL